MTNDPDNTITRNEVEATQGSKAPRLVYVLVASLGLAVVAVAIVWLNLR